MKIDILTLFPQAVESSLNFSILARARQANLVKIAAHNLRDWAIDSHGTVDDTPYGGGPGMILRADVAYRALEAVDPNHQAKRIMLAPGGEQFNQKIAKELALLERLVLLCGRYEGFDARISNFVDQELSIGPYILSGGELAAAVVSDVLTRLLPGVLGNKESLNEETFEDDAVEYPQYTRPDNFEGTKVPEVLKSGHHQEIANWRKQNQRKIITDPVSQNPQRP